MKKLVRSLFSLLILSALCSNATIASDVDKYEVKVKEVSARTAIFTVEARQSTNIVGINTSEGIVVVDTETSPTFTAAIREKMIEHFGGDKFIYLINTHHHGDHTYGNQIFSDATIVGHEKCSEMMIEDKDAPGRLVARLNQMLPGLRARLAGMKAGTPQAEGMKSTVDYYSGLAEGLGEGFVLTVPDKTFPNRSRIDSGDMSFQLYYFGYSHTISDIVIYCPEEKIVMTGDIFYKDNDPYIDTERVPHIGRMREVCGMITKLGDSLDYMIPGHGDSLSVDVVRQFDEALGRVQEEIGDRKSAYTEVTGEYEKKGADKAAEKFEKLWKKQDDYYFFFSEFDSFVYRIMLDGDPDDALTLFEMLASYFPEEPNAWDSLGEICMRKELREKAIEAFKKSLELDPENGNAQRRLAELQGE